jgi:hypothetical protein
LERITGTFRKKVFLKKIKKGKLTPKEESSLEDI